VTVIVTTSVHGHGIGVWLDWTSLGGIDYCLIIFFSWDPGTCHRHSRCGYMSMYATFWGSIRGGYWVHGPYWWLKSEDWRGTLPDKKKVSVNFNPNSIQVHVFEKFKKKLMSW